METFTSNEYLFLKLNLYTTEFNIVEIIGWNSINHAILADSLGIYKFELPICLSKPHTKVKRKG